jgi:hypothetical protein
MARGLVGWLVVFLVVFDMHKMALLSELFLALCCWTG